MPAEGKTPGPSEGTAPGGTQLVASGFADFCHG